MFDPVLTTLLTTAIGLAVFHTVVGVDHYLPFVVLGRARSWGLGKTLWVASLCGFGHVLSSILLGGVGLALGFGVERLSFMEETRGGWAAWSLIVFGLVYAIWSWRRERAGVVHEHAHAHIDGSVHKHEHNHAEAHAHAHAHAHVEPGKHMTSWALFIVFVLGPCEVLIPLLMAPAAMHHWSWAMTVALVFGVATLTTMLVMTVVGWLSADVLKRTPLRRFRPYAGTLAGVAIAASGLAIQLLGA